MVKKYEPNYEIKDLTKFGDYRLVLTNDEIKEYLSNRAYFSGPKKYKDIYRQKVKLFKIFCKLAGVNTCAVGPQGQGLMYRHDVHRFSDLMFKGTPTIFD